MHTKQLQQRGAVTVEYALGFLLFFAILLAIMDFARFVASNNILAGATREGARYAIVHGAANPTTQSHIQNIVRRWCVGLDRNAVIVTVSYPDGGNARGQRVRVRSTYPMSPFTRIIMNPWSFQSWTGTITVASLSDMVISQ